eukprot:1203240-Prymnesium_polylepis.1
METSTPTGVLAHGATQAAPGPPPAFGRRNSGSKRPAGSEEEQEPHSSSLSTYLPYEELPAN